MKSISASIIYPAALSLLVLGACAGDPVEPPELEFDTETPGLIVTDRSATAFTGTFNEADMPLGFRSTERTPRNVEVALRVGDTRLTMRTDYAKGEFTFDARSGQLAPAQIAAIDRLFLALADAYGNEAAEPTNAEVALRRSLNYLRVAPPSTALPTFTAVSETGWVYLSCTCSWQYIGSGWAAMAGKGETCGSSGSPHCPGRCGIGCGPDNLKWPWSWGSGVYTQDCALHDYGLGSWTNAADDYALAPYNCG